MKRTLMVALCALLATPVQARADAKKGRLYKRQGDTLLRFGAYAKAEAAYRRAIAEDPDLEDAYRALSTHYLRQQQYAKAAKLLGQALRRRRRFAEGWYSYAYALRKLGRHDEAITAYRSYSRLRPKSADPYYGLGLAHRGKKDFAAAARAFRTYARMEKSARKRAWVKKARKLAAQMERAASAAAAKAKAAAPKAKAAAPKAKAAAPKAKAAAPKAAAAAPPAARPASPSGPAPGAKLSPERRRAWAHKKRGDRLVRAGRLVPAIKAYRAALAADFSFTPAYDRLGHCLFALRRHREAVRVFRIAIRDNPNYALGWYNLAYASRKAGLLREAVAAYRKYAAAKPADPDPYFGLGLAYRALKDKAAAIKAFNAYIRRERRAKQRKWVARAQRIVRKLGGTPAKPGSAPVAGGKARVATAKGKPTATDGKPKTALPPDIFAKAFKAATGKEVRKSKRKGAPKRLSARERRRRAAARRREDRRLARVLRRRKLAEKRRKAREARAKRRRERIERRRKARAARLARIAERRRKRQARVAARRAKAARRRGAVAAVRRVALKAPAVAPAADRPAPIPVVPAPRQTGTTTAEKLRVQADTLARAKRCAKAWPLYRRALAADPFHTAAYDGLAYCAYQLKRPRAGIARLGVALRDNPDYHAGWLHLARLRRLAGEETAAVGSYRRYLKVKPKDAAARFELARALRHAGLKQQAVAAYRAYLLADRGAERRPEQAAAHRELKALGGAAPLVAVAAAGKGKAAAGRAAAQPRSKLPPDVLKAALRAARIGTAAGKGKGVAAKTAKPKKLSARERRRLRRLAAKRRRAAARRARLERLKKRRAARKARREARLLARKKRREARLARLRLARKKRREAREARLRRRRARAARAAEDRMLARLARKRRGRRRAARRKRRAVSAPTARLASRVSTDLDATPRVPPRIKQRDVLKPAPDAARGLVQVADRQFAKQRYVIALGIYRQAAKLDPTATEPLYKAGVCAVAMRRMHAAAELFQQVLQVDPTNATARTNLQLARAAAKRSKPSRAYLRSALRRAERAVASGSYAAAERSLNALAAKMPTSAKVYLLRADARLGLRRPRAALGDAGRALALDPGDPSALRALGDAHRQLGRKKKALYYYRLFLARTAGAQTGPQQKSVKRAVAELES